MSAARGAYRVAVEGGEIAFLCEPDETVLDAAERGGFALPYSCRKGACASCEADLTSGAVRERGRGLVTGPAQAVKLCQATACSDLEIAPKRISPRDPNPRKVLDARLHRLHRPTPDVSILKLRFPNGVRAKFRAGQHLKLLFEDGDSRSYSMANPPQLNDGAELHVREIAGGRFSMAALARLQPGAAVRVETPFGEASLSDRPERPLILVVTGTGFAPAKSIIEDQLRRRGERPVRLYWGGRRIEDLYLAELARGWAEQAPWFSFTPVLSRPAAGWSGRTGWVQQAALEDQPDLSRCEAYACGNSAMTTAAHDAFLEAGLPPARFHCDAFTPSGDSPPTPA